MIKTLRSDVLVTLSTNVAESMKQLIMTSFPVESKTDNAPSKIGDAIIVSLEKLSADLLSPLICTLKNLDERTAAAFLPMLTKFIINRVLFELYSRGRADRIDPSEIRKVLNVLECAIDPLYSSTKGPKRKMAFAAISRSDSDGSDVIISNLVRPIFNHVYAVIDKDMPSNLISKLPSDLLWSECFPSLSPR